MSQSAATVRSLVHATTYNRANCDIGVVHLGYGAFHRAHQAVFFDDYMEATGDLRWGIAAVNLRPSEAAHFFAAQRPKNGYLLKAIAPDGMSELRLVRSHCHFADWSVDADEAEALLALPTVHAVTITVTESGYYMGHDGGLDVDDPQLQSEFSGQGAHSVYAYLARGLARRMAGHGQPINVLCCDNIRANGKMLQRNILSYLERLGHSDLLAWTVENVSFPCAMVDRITPRSTQALVAEMQKLFPQNPLDPVQSESFKQWVLATDFNAPMPDLTKAGVQLVDDVDPFEEAKIRILNGGHTALCYFGALAGYTTFDQAFNDPRLRAIFDAYQRDEVLVGLEDIAVPFDTHAYVKVIAARFSNAAIADQLERICMDGFSKFPIYIRPTLEACMKRGVVPYTGLRCVASWYVYARRWVQGATAVPYREPQWRDLEPLLAVGQEAAFANHAQLWANLPQNNPDFEPLLTQAIFEMEEQWPA
ncbi:MAG: mannitol dehydrogenase family protein [Pseudomonadota bacterium]